MGKFFLNGETHRVTFPDGEWVDVKAELSQADNDYILSKMVTKGQVDVSLGRIPLMERAIVAWSFADDKPIPVTLKNISNLKTKYRSTLLSEIDRLNSEAGSFAKN